MKTILNIFKSDIRAITKYIFVLIIVIALGTLPSLYAWINIYANWDPYSETGNVEVALASRDSGIDLKDGRHVNSLVFTLIVYSLVFALENIGLAVGVIFMILQVAGGGGTFPVEVLPAPFRALFPFMPFRYAMDAMRECIGGMYDHTYIKCLGILILFGLAAIAFGLLLHKPMRGIIEKVEESKRESDVML